MAACDDPLPRAQETPEGAFVLRGVHIDDRRPDGSTWRGTAERAEGSLDLSDFEQIKLTITSGDRGRVYLVRAPRGTMNFETRKGDFYDLTVTDEQGGVLEAGVGHFDGETDTLTTEGPMHFTAQGVRMTARRGVIDLDTGELDVEGPVNGVYQRPPASD